MEALDGTAAGADTQLVLSLDGPITPLVLSEPGRPGVVSQSMPIRFDAAANAG